MATLQEMEQALVIATKNGRMDNARRLKFAIDEANKDVSNQIPGNPTLNSIPKAPERSIGEELVGAADALTTGISAGTTGLIGQAFGTMKGAIEQGVYGNFGTQEGARAIAQSAAEGASIGTLGPYTQTGQENLQSIGETIGQLPPVVGALRPVGAISSGIKGAGMYAERAGGAAVTGVKSVSQLKADVGAILKQRIDEVFPTEKSAPSAPSAVANSPPVSAAPEPQIPKARPIDSYPEQTITGEPAPTPLPNVPKPVVAEPMGGTELIKTAKKAAEGGFGSNKALGTLTEQIAPDPKVLASAKRLGVTEDLQADHVTTNQAYREYAQAVKSHPGSEARAKELEGLANVAKRADKLIEDIGGSHDLSQVNQKVKITLDEYREKLDAEANAHYEELRENIPSSTRAPADTVLAFVNQRKKEFDGNVGHLSKLERMVLKRLTPREIKTKSHSTSQGVLKYPDNNRPPSYATLDDVRRIIGDATKRRGDFKDANSGLARKLYAAISEDQERVASAAGMGETFKAAKLAVVARKEVEDNIVGLFGRKQNLSIVGRLNASVRLLPVGNIGAFVKLMKGVPDDMKQEVVASSLLAAFGKTARQGSLNFSSYASWYEGVIKNKLAYKAIMDNLPKDARKQLLDLYRVSKAISMSTKERITTGRLQAVTEALKGADNLIVNVYEATKHNVLSSVAGAITGTIVGPGVGVAIASALTKGPKPKAIVAADALISSPEFLQGVKLMGKGETKKASRRIAYSAPFVKFTKAVGNSIKPADRIDWVLKAIERAETPDAALVGATALQAVRDNPNTQTEAARN